MKGFSIRNLKYMRRFAEVWTEDEFVQQVAAQLPWFHNCVLLDKVADDARRKWYARAAIHHGWSRAVLVHQIESVGCRHFLPAQPNRRDRRAGSQRCSGPEWLARNPRGHGDTPKACEYSTVRRAAFEAGTNCFQKERPSSTLIFHIIETRGNQTRVRNAYLHPLLELLLVPRLPMFRSNLCRERLCANSFAQQ